MRTLQLLRYVIYCLVGCITIYSFMSRLLR